MQQNLNEQADRSLTFALYILYILAIFTAGILAIIALIINYVRLDRVKGTLFESHFRWQIRSFWWYLFWNVIAIIPFFFLLFTGENPDAFFGVALGASSFCFAVIGLSWIWIVYRAIRGMINLSDGKAMYTEQ